MMMLMVVVVVMVMQGGGVAPPTVPIDCGLALFVRPVDQVPYVVGEVGRVGVDAVALGLLKYVRENHCRLF